MPLQIPLPTTDPYSDIAQYIPLLISSIEGFLQAHDVWAAADYNQAYSYMEQLKTYLVDTLPPVNNAFLIYFTHFHHDSKVTAGNALDLLINTGQVHNHVFRQNTPANGDTFEFKVPLKAGNYTIDIMGTKSSAAGKLEFSADGTILSTLDFYSAATALNQVFSVTLTVATDKVVTFQGHVNGKNASSSGFVINIIYFAIHPT